MKIKCGRNEFNLTKEDTIMFNGTCYMLITREVFRDWRNYSPTIAKTRAKKLIKDGLLVPVTLEKPPYNGEKITYYKISR